jgi:hypothetical protein
MRKHFYNVTVTVSDHKARVHFPDFGTGLDFVTGNYPFRAEIARKCGSNNAEHNSRKSDHSRSSDGR